MNLKGIAKILGRKRKDKVTYLEQGTHMVDVAW